MFKYLSKLFFVFGFSLVALLSAQALSVKNAIRIYNSHTFNPPAGYVWGKCHMYDLINFRFVDGYGGKNANADISELGYMTAAGMDFGAGNATRFMRAPEGKSFSDYDNVSQIRSDFNSGASDSAVYIIKTGDLILVRIRNSQTYGVMLLTEVVENPSGTDYQYYYVFDYKYGTYNEDPNTGEYPNLVLIAGWEGLTDDLGSTISVDTIRQQSDTIVSASYSIEHSDEVNGLWPWAQMSAYTDGDYSEVTSFKVSYSSDTPFKMTLDQPGLAEDGLSYGYILPTAQELSEIVISIDEFDQPEWVETAIELNLSEVSSISFSPVGYGKDAQISLKEVTARGYMGTPVSYEKLGTLVKRMSLYSAGDKIVFSSKNYGIHTFKLYNSRGVLLEKRSVDVNGEKQVVLGGFLPLHLVST